MSAILSHALIVLDIASMKVFVWVLGQLFTWAVDPNAGILTYAPGAAFPLHKHDFAQVWYVIEGELTFGGRQLKAGEMVFMADPHFEYGMQTARGCKILFVQYPGPTTGARPIYDGRFNQTVPTPIAEADLEH